MTQIDNFPVTDPIGAANHIGTMLHVLFHGGLDQAHTPAPQEPATTGSVSDPVNQVLSDPGNQPAQPDATVTTSTTGGDTTAAAGTTSGDVVPAGTAVSQPYGAGNSRDQGGHPGIDLAVPTGTPIHAAVSGQVTWSGADDSGYGTWVDVVTPDGTEIRYGHLSKTDVQIGQEVKAGTELGLSGATGNATGPHLHFEVRQGGHTVDPTPWLAAGHAIANTAPQETTVTRSQNVYDQNQVAHAQLANTAAILSGQPATESPESKTVTTTQKTAKAGTAGAAGDTDPSGVEAFLAATRKHESGGNYQIYNQSGLSNASGAYQFIGSTWKGLGGSTANAAEASPEEQDRIARAYALQLFQQFHSWRLVAAAWYGGPGVAEQMAQGQNAGSPSGQGSYSAYADTIQGMMSRGKEPDVAATVDMDFLTFMNAIQTQYPSLIPILNQPGVLAVVSQAIHETWPASRLEAELQGTPYYKETPLAKRQWDVLNAADPATAKEKAGMVLQQIHDLEASTGIRFTTPQMEFQFLVDATQNGWDANQIKYNIMSSVNTLGGGGGETGNNAATVRSMADDYAVPMSDEAALGWGKQMTKGAVTPEAMKGYLVESAKRSYSQFTNELDRGITIRQIADPYLQIMQKETGENTATMSMTDPRLLKALDTVDPKTGAHYAQSLPQWTATVRTDPTFGYDTSANAHQQVATLATQVAQRMGAI